MAKNLIAGTPRPRYFPPSPEEQNAIEESLSSERLQREEAEAARRVVRDHFNSLTSFQYERLIGSGVFGVACSVIEKRRAKPQRRLVVKRANAEDAEGELEHEIITMSRLNGSAHIAMVLAARYDDENVQRPGVFKRLVSKIIRRKNNMLVGLPGPTLVLEHLENGTVDNLLNKLRQRNKSLPNRVLWSFFLCLVRACVAMRYPLEQPFGAKPRLEEIPDTVPDLGIVHSDMHSNNVLIGSTGDFPEHAVVPPMKLIDFGLSRTKDGAECDPQNLLDAGKQIYYLITGRYGRVGIRYEDHHGVSTMAWEILPHSGQDPYPMLDNDLRTLVARCLAKEPADRPRLAEALEICKTAVEVRTPGYYGFNLALETDSAIRQLLQETLYDPL
ncbi:kinase-like domain-containing protein [Xylaria flabelliformis]|nr:kinase-like domain-containing protein [Xylaria flabelliformis]